MFFFFSSRRRHTRWNCDWSSDVCSSDLAGSREKSATQLHRVPTQKQSELDGTCWLNGVESGGVPNELPRARFADPGGTGRSEERRVGKECRSRWWPEH